MAGVLVRGKGAPYLSCLGGTLHKWTAASAPLPHPEAALPHWPRELGRDLSVAACQVGSELRPAEGLPPTAAISGDSLGVTLSAPAPCLCHMNVFSGPPRPSPPSEKDTALLQEPESTTSSCHGRGLACEGRTHSRGAAWG